MKSKEGDKGNSRDNGKHGGKNEVDYDNPDPEFWLKKVVVEMDIITLMAVHGNLLLALRHPQNIGYSRQYVVELVKQAGEELVRLGAIDRERLIVAYRVETEEGNPDFLEEMEKLKSEVVQNTKNPRG